MDTTTTALNAPSKTVTITLEEFTELVEARDFLYRLEAAGVDNWDGYHLAMEGDDDDPFFERD
jgi:hypothetical protein